MKRFKLGLLTVAMMASSLAVNAAGIIGNEFEKISRDSKVVIMDTSGQHGMEAKAQDEVALMTWDTARKAVEAYGPGWRLPTIAELKLLYEQRTLIGGFANDDYWSSTEQDVNSAWIQGFGLGDQDRYNKQSTLKVRAVRSF
jgi:hypothetical protein